MRECRRSACSPTIERSRHDRTASTAQNECVEVNTGAGAVIGFRDSKDTAAGTIAVTAGPFTDFASALGAGEL
ncbi:DUF397 domain-containing protein [Streptomyces roseolus]|uniref:DUF397 domain-containing protein n=1 Tax=Streptomyces roseolus TaxID=67358 RepID=UPI0036FAD58F